MTGKIKLVHSGGNAVSIAVPTSNPSSSEVEFKLPQTDGSTGQFMKTDGSGNLSFAAAGGGKVVAQKFASVTTNEQTTSGNQTWTLVGPQITHTAASTSNKLVFLHSHHLMIEGSMTWHMGLWRDGTACTGITNCTATPPDTSSHTYQFAIYRSGGSDSLIRYSPNSDSTGSQIMMLEVEP